jgi:hypothetical protein
MSGPWTEKRAPAAERFTAWCRAHAPGIILAAALAAAIVVAGYVALGSRLAPKIELIGAAPPGAPIATGTAAAVRDTVAWRDETGTVFRAKVDPRELEGFLQARRKALEAVRTETREQASAEILAALKPVFADMKERVPSYANWYSSYATTYELVAQGLLAALDYLGRSLDIFSPQPESLYAFMAARLVDYLQEQYAEQVVRPQTTQVRVQVAFDKSYATLRAHWERLIADQRLAMRQFIEHEAGAQERLSAVQAGGVTLDWDGQRDDRAVMHEDVNVEQSFRRGLLTVRLKLPRFGRAPAELDTRETSRVDSDKIRGTILTMFDKLVGTVVSQMGNLALGIFAGGTAGGSVGLGFGMPAIPGAVAGGGIATAVPIGALIGFATTVVAEMITNRVQASLTRQEFENTLRQSVDATENAVETAIIGVLHQQIEAWYADINPP